MKVVWTARARSELDEVADYLAPLSAAAALKIVRRIRTAGNRLKDYPHAGRPGQVEDSRELVVSGTPYILPYRVQDDRAEILAVLHAYRLWPDQF